MEKKPEQTKGAKPKVKDEKGSAHAGRASTSIPKGNTTAKSTKDGKQHRKKPSKTFSSKEVYVHTTRESLSLLKSTPSEKAKSSSKPSTMIEDPKASQKPFSKVAKEDLKISSTSKSAPNETKKKPETPVSLPQTLDSTNSPISYTSVENKDEAQPAAIPSESGSVGLPQDPKTASSESKKAKSSAKPKGMIEDSKASRETSTKVVKEELEISYSSESAPDDTNEKPETPVSLPQTLDSTGSSISHSSAENKAEAQPVAIPSESGSVGLPQDPKAASSEYKKAKSSSKPSTMLEDPKTSQKASTEVAKESFEIPSTSKSVAKDTNEKPETPVNLPQTFGSTDSSISYPSVAIKDETQPVATPSESDSVGLPQGKGDKSTEIILKSQPPTNLANASSAQSNLGKKLNSFFNALGLPKSPTTSPPIITELTQIDFDSISKINLQQYLTTSSSTEKPIASAPTDLVKNICETVDSTHAAFPESSPWKLPDDYDVAEMIKAILQTSPILVKAIDSITKNKPLKLDEDAVKTPGEDKPQELQQGEESNFEEENIHELKTDQNKEPQKANFGSFSSIHPEEQPTTSIKSSQLFSMVKSAMDLHSSIAKMSAVKNKRDAQASGEDPHSSDNQRGTAERLEDAVIPLICVLLSLAKTIVDPFASTELEMDFTGVTSGAKVSKSSIIRNRKDVVEDEGKAKEDNFQIGNVSPTEQPVQMEITEISNSTTSQNSPENEDKSSKQLSAIPEEEGNTEKSCARCQIIPIYKSVGKDFEIEIPESGSVLENQNFVWKLRNLLKNNRKEIVPIVMKMSSQLIHFVVHNMLVGNDVTKEMILLLLSTIFIDVSVCEFWCLNPIWMSRLIQSLLETKKISVAARKAISELFLRAPTQFLFTHLCEFIAENSENDLITEVIEQLMLLIDVRKVKDIRTEDIIRTYNAIISYTNRNRTKYVALRNKARNIIKEFIEKVGREHFEPYFPLLVRSEFEF